MKGPPMSRWFYRLPILAYLLIVIGGGIAVAVWG